MHPDDEMFDFKRLFGSAKERSYLEGKNGVESAIEVYERNGALHFKLKLVPFGQVEGEFPVNFAYLFLMVWASHIFCRVESGGSFDGSPFSKSGMKLSTKGSGQDRDPPKMLEEFAREAVIQVVSLFLTRLRSLPERALTDALISIVLGEEWCTRNQQQTTRNLEGAHETGYSRLAG